MADGVPSGMLEVHRVHTSGSACLSRQPLLARARAGGSKEAQTAALKHEVQLLRAENAYLRDALTGSGASTAVSQISMVGAVRPAVPVDPAKPSLGQPNKQPAAEVSLCGCHLQFLIE